MTTKPTADSRVPARPSASSHFRPDVQGLRTVAVGAVVLFHLWPNRVSGGFVGVDVFFVVSGFLITGHLLREAESTGTIRLLRFWGRRIARLLPASFLALAAITVATFVLVPKDLWSSYFRQIRASALYFENWQLASDAVDYMAIGAEPTAVQHYWSLSIEEQFYLVWPVVIVLALLLVRKFFRKIDIRTSLILLLTLILVTSLWFSITATTKDHSWAYFATFTRVWEFAAGGLVALTAVFISRKLHESSAGGVAGWVGLLLIAWSAITFSGATLFPGFTALVPVLGTCLVLYFGDSTSAVSPKSLLAWRPMVWIGGISYAIYLWHWGPIVVLPLVTGSELRTLDKILIGIFTLAIAQVSTKYVETPLRTSRFFAKPRNGILFAAMGALLFVGVTALGDLKLERDEAAAQAAVEARMAQSCVGPAALDPTNNCPNPMGEGEYVVPPDVVAQQNEGISFGECQQAIVGADVKSCELGESGRATSRVILAGDSHASQWFEAFDRIGKQEGWNIQTFSKASCPLSETRRVLTSEQNSEAADSCDTWVDQVVSEIVASDADTVVLTSYQSAYQWEARPNGPQLADPVDGFATIFEQIANSGKNVVVIKAVPRTNGEYVTRCLIENGRDLEKCGARREQALPTDLMEEAVHNLSRPDVTLLNLDSTFCDDQWCYPVVGDMVVYRDYSHISAEYANSLAQRLVEAVESAHK